MYGAVCDGLAPSQLESASEWLGIPAGLPSRIRIQTQVDLIPTTTARQNESHYRWLHAYTHIHFNQNRRTSNDWMRPSRTCFPCFKGPGLYRCSVGARSISLFLYLSRSTGDQDKLPVMNYLMFCNSDLILYSTLLLCVLTSLPARLGECRSHKGDVMMRLFIWLINIFWTSCDDGFLRKLFYPSFFILLYWMRKR